MESIVSDPHLGDEEDTIILSTTLCKASPFYRNQICDYKVLSPDEIVQYVVKFVQEINGIVQLNPTITRMLLSHCKWDKDVMVEKLYDNREKLFREAHVMNPAGVNITAQSDSKECLICYAELSPSLSAESACGHKFCTTCWSEYLRVKIMDDGVGNSIACAASDCDVIIDDERVIQLVGDSETKLRYQHLITNSFVQQNKLLRWCPARGCSYAIKVDYAASKSICCHCKCGNEFCFDCSKEYHAPVRCDLLERFKTHTTMGSFGLTRTRAGLISQTVTEPGLISQTYVVPGFTSQPLTEPGFISPTSTEPEFLSLNRTVPPFGPDLKIKLCPNPVCRLTIQKIGGCHAMKCKNCESFFCWECLNRYKTTSEAHRHSCTDAIAVKQKSFTERVKVANPLEDDTKLLSNVPLGVLAYPQEQVARSDEGPSTSQGTNELQKRVSVTAKRGLIFNRPWYWRYNCNVRSLALAAKHFAASKNELEKCSERSRNVLMEFELASLEWVRSCQTLKYSRVFDSYAIDVIESKLLNVLVYDLELAVAELARSFEVVNLKIMETYAKITKVVSPAYTNCQLRRRALLDYVDEGFDNEWWTFREEPLADTYGEPMNKFSKLNSKYRFRLD